MGQRVNSETILKFHTDRNLLPITDAEIARSMGMDRSNYSSYVNGHLPITLFFLRKFYSAWGDKIDTLKLKNEVESSEVAEIVKTLSVKVGVLEKESEYQKKEIDALKNLAQNDKVKIQLLEKMLSRINGGNPINHH